MVAMGLVYSRVVSRGTGVWYTCAVIRQGVLKSFNSTPYTAVVQVQGSLAVWLADVPVSRDIASGEMQAGRKVAVLFFDEGNEQDAVVLGVWT